MILIYDRASAAAVSARTLDPPTRVALEAELALLTVGEHDLTDCTDILLVQADDTEADIGREAGFSPLVDPISGARFDQPTFEAGWDLLTLRGGVFRFVFTFGSTHASIMLVPDADGILPELLTLCRHYAAKQRINRCVTASRS